MDDKFITVKVKRTVVEKVRELAAQNYRTVPQQIEYIVDKYIATTRMEAYDLLIKESEQK